MEVCITKLIKNFDVIELQAARRILYEVARQVSLDGYSPKEFDMIASIYHGDEVDAIDDRSYEAIKAMAFENPGWRR